MAWTKKGNFSTVFHTSHGTRLNRTCDYENSAPINISEFSLAGYSDGDYMIVATAPNDATYKRLVEQMLRAGFPKPDFASKHLKNVSLVTSDPALIASFLLAVKEVAPELAEIEAEVCQSLGVNLSARAVVPTWHRLGDFTTRHSMGVPLNRQVLYRTGVPGAAMHEFALYGYEDRSCLFEINLVGRASSDLKQALIATGLPLQFSDHSENIQFRFNPSTVADFNRLLSIISQHSPHFNEICDDFKQHVIPVITAPIAASARARLFQGESAATAAQLSAGTNDAKLTEIGFNQDIPPEYCCSLSLAIMTEPVYVRGLEQYQFEKSWILRHLATSSTHPFTRQPLTQADLVPNDTLRAAITTFMDNAIHEHQEQKTPGK